MSTAILPINMTFLRTKISKLGTDRKDFKTLRSNKLAVITSTRESDKLTSIIANEFKLYNPKQITERSINVAGYEVVIKRHRDQRDTIPNNIRNEFKFVEYINQAIKDNGYPLTINFQSSNKNFIVPNVSKALHVGSSDIFSGKKADTILYSGNKVVPISLKQDNASRWASPDIDLKRTAERFFQYVIKNKITTLKEFKQNIYKIDPPVGFKLTENIGNYMVFGTDIKPNGCIIVKTWTTSDFNLDYSKENILNVKCNYLFKNYQDLPEKYIPYFILRNDSTRKVASNIIPPGLRYEIAYEGGAKRGVKIINYTP